MLDAASYSLWQDLVLTINGRRKLLEIRVDIAVLNPRDPSALQDVHTMLHLGYAVAKGRTRVTHLRFEVK